MCLLDMVDKACPVILEKLLPHLPVAEKLLVLTQPNLDLMWVADRAVTVWLPAGGGTLQEGNQINYRLVLIKLDIQRNLETKTPGNKNRWPTKTILGQDNPFKFHVE